MKQKLKGWYTSLENKNYPDEADAKKLVSLYSIQVPPGRKLGPEDEFEIEDIVFQSLLPEVFLLCFVCGPGFIFSVNND